MLVYPYAYGPLMFPMISTCIDPFSHPISNPLLPGVEARTVGEPVLFKKAPSVTVIVTTKIVSGDHAKEYGQRTC